MVISLFQAVKSTPLVVFWVLVVPILGSLLRLGALLQAVPPHWSLLIFLGARRRPGPRSKCTRMARGRVFNDLQAGEGLQALMQAADTAGHASGAQAPGLAAQGEHGVANADQSPNASSSIGVGLFVSRFELFIFIF